MLNIDSNGGIHLTRGDTARLQIYIENEADEEEYQITDNDVLRFTVRRSADDPVPAFRKTVKGSSTFHIEPKDTKRLSFGSYVYDVELTTPEDDVYTVIGPCSFEIMKEVTF